MNTNLSRSHSIIIKSFHVPGIIPGHTLLARLREPHRADVSRTETSESKMSTARAHKDLHNTRLDAVTIWVQIKQPMC